ncbi:MAG: rhomboid family intramembrane serine protease, partial [Anaerolineae bacterium]|nr:rhomboid family intramembrane serine protease [Anaerolineae bacterium]
TISDEKASQRLPILTIIVVIITAVGAVLQFVNPAVLTALRRDPNALAASQWWRLISPLLVLDGNLWVHFALDVVGFLIVGTVVERRFGSLRWFILFITAALVGELVGYVWDPTGAGASIALCGLMGGLVIWQIRHKDLQFIPSLYTVGLIAALTFEAIAALLTSDSTVEVIIAVVVCAVLINVLVILRGRASDPGIPTYYVGAVTLLGAVILLFLHDIHGAALLTGLVVAVGVLWLRDRPIFK